MPKPTNKQELLDEAEKEYEALKKQLAEFTPEEMVRPGVIGVWSIKDILAHLLEWQRMYMGWYEAGLRGEKPATPAKGYNWSELPALNQDIYERYKDAKLDNVRNQLETSHRHMLDVAGRSPRTSCSRRDGTSGPASAHWPPTSTSTPAPTTTVHRQASAGEPTSGPTRRPL